MIYKKIVKPGGFQNAFDSLPHNKRQESMEEICNLCFWNECVFKSRKIGKTPFRSYEIERIEEYFKSKNLNAWS